MVRIYVSLQQMECTLQYLRSTQIFYECFIRGWVIESSLDVVLVDQSARVRGNHGHIYILKMGAAFTDNQLQTESYDNITTVVGVVHLQFG